IDTINAVLDFVDPGTPFEFGDRHRADLESRGGPSRRSSRGLTEQSQPMGSINWVEDNRRLCLRRSRNAAGPQLAVSGDEIERLRGEAQTMMTLYRRMEIAVDRGTGRLGPCSVGCRRQFVLQCDDDLQPMTGDDRFEDTVIVERLRRGGEEVLPIVDM